MKNKFYSIITISIFLTAVFSLQAQTHKTKTNFIKIVIPSSDTITTALKKFRLAASTLPKSRVTMNGKKLKVYRSGAFVSLMKLDIGKNVFVIRSYGRKGKKVTKTFVIIRKDITLKTTPEDTLRIEKEMMLPSKNIWLDAGDILEVKFKGTPNCKASFMNGIPMVELPPSETNGLGGIYAGSYKVKDTDDLFNQPITFKLQNQEGYVAEMESKAKVSFLSQEFPRVGITKGERPYLNYGLGNDRLGGAKLSFLEPGIKLKINGKVGNQYRVMLTNDFEAWIPEDQVKLLPVGIPIPKTLTGAWHITGDKKYDYLKVNLSEKIPYSTRQEIDPTRIIVDLYGAVSNSNWITQHLNSTEIRNVSYEQVSKNLFRIVIEPVHKQIWGYEITYRGNNLVIRIKHQPKVLRLNKLKFAIDAGHGGRNRGALGATGLLEKDVTLKIAKDLKRALEAKGAKVILTRKTDKYYLNTERLKTVLNSNADILISIHANSAGMSANPVRAAGTSTYYKHICFRPLSQFIYKRMLKLKLKPFGNIGGFNFTLNSPTEIPNVLVETAFISNPSEEMKLMSSRFRKAIARQIVRGVEDFLKSVKKKSLNN